MNAIAKQSRRALVPQEPQALTVTGPSSTDRLFDFIGRAITDSSVSADKLEIIIRLEREMVADHRRLRYQGSMSQAQAEMVPVVRDTRNSATNSWFAKLEKIDGAIRPIYTGHGFFLSFDEEISDREDRTITCKVAAHGHEEIHRLRAPLDIFGPKGLPNKTPLHGLGSTVSYLRRYLTCMIFNVILISEDNDGNRMRYDQAEGGQPPDGELAGKSQAAELYALLRECSVSPLPEAERAFLTKMRLGHLRSLRDVPAGDFPKLKNTLIGKRQRMRDAASDISAGDVK